MPPKVNESRGICLIMTVLIVVPSAQKVWNVAYVPVASKNYLGRRFTATGILQYVQEDVLLKSPIKV